MDYEKLTDELLNELKPLKKSLANQLNNVSDYSYDVCYENLDKTATILKKRMECMHIILDSLSRAKYLYELYIEKLGDIQLDSYCEYHMLLDRISEIDLLYLKYLEKSSYSKSQQIADCYDFQSI